MTSLTVFPSSGMHPCHYQPADVQLYTYIRPRRTLSHDLDPSPYTFWHQLPKMSWLS